MINNENINPDEISLSSFEVNDELNPKLWIGDELRTEIRLHLLDIAHDFFETLSVKWVEPKDVVLTGSLANYNWSEYSDIDLHIYVDYGEVYDKKEFVDDYFNSKKIIWNESHENLKVCGFPVEVYVEDVSSPSESSGIYSLVTNDWLVEPQDLDDALINSDYVKKASAKCMDKVDMMYEKMEGADKEKLSKISDDADRLFNLLKDNRKKGLKSEYKEMSSGNIIWKILRRNGYLDKLFDIMDFIYDKIKSV